MRRPGGYAILSGGDGPTQEWDTFTCFHCQSIVQVKPLADAADSGGRCMVCDKLICKTCLGKGCLPFEKKIEAMEARDRFRRSLGI